MKAISVSSVLKRTCIITAVAVMVSGGSIANALNGVQFNQFSVAPNSAQASELQLAKIECKGNWVNAGCTSPPPSASGWQGSAPADTNQDCCERFNFAQSCACDDS